MKYLFDTCVISETSKPLCDSSVKSLVAKLSPDASISVLTLGEISKGVALMSEEAGQRTVQKWLHKLTEDFSDRVLPIDLQTALVWGELTARLQAKGTILPSIDGLLAATALRYDLSLVTRNTRHFKATSARIIDPWAP